MNERVSNRVEGGKGGVTAAPARSKPVGTPLPPALPSPLATTGEKAESDSLREAVFSPVAASVPPVAPNGLAPGRLRWRVGGSYSWRLQLRHVHSHLEFDAT